MKKNRLKTEGKSAPRLRGRMQHAHAELCGKGSPGAKPFLTDAKK